MKIIIFPTIAEQLLADPDRDAVDPAGVVHQGSYPLLMGNDFHQPVATVSNLRLEDGRLVGDVDLEVGWGGVVEEVNVYGEVRAVDRLRLLYASFIRQPAKEKL